MSEQPNFPLSGIPEISGQLTAAAQTVIHGADHTVRMLTAAVFCGGHVLLEDLPGTGKTTLVKAFAILTGCESARVQCTPDLMPADLTGFEMLMQKPDGTREMTFRRGPVFTNLLLADEINRTTPRSQSGLLECMAERQVTCGGKQYALPEPFLVIATQNPIELQGTFPLPEAQLDRFFMRLTMGQPDRAAECEILRGRQCADPLDALKPVTSPEQICQIQRAVRTVSASDDVLHYMLDLADASRRHPKIRFGLSTRAVLALRHAAQAVAAMQGRDYLLPDDVKAVFPAVCTHRLQTAGGLLNDPHAAEQLTAELLDTTEVPKV